MKYYKILILFLCSFWQQTIDTNAAEVKHDNQPVLNFFMKSSASGEPSENMDDKLESIKISNEVRIMIVCTTKSVHMWDGKIDLGKFVVGTTAVRRNSTGNFSSVLMIRLREAPIQDFPSLQVTPNYLKCFELKKEQDESGKCIYLKTDLIEYKKSKNLTKKDGQQRVSISFDSCPQIPKELENDSTQGEISIPKNVPEFLWNAENNSVVCHVDNPSRIQLKSIYCEDPSWCNIHTFCTIQTCPSLVSIHSCQKGCNSQSMTVNYVTGQLHCEANGFSSSLNYITDFNSEICYFKPGGSVSVCQVLDLQTPNVDVFHGLPLQLSGRASKFVIIQKPEVHIILSNGQVIRSIGAPPQITGLPTELHLLKTFTGLPFRTAGLPIPKFELIFNGQIVTKTDGRFSLFVDQKENTYLKIDTSNGTFSGLLKISSSNFLGIHNCTISIQETLRLTRTEAYAVAAVLAILLIFVPYYLFKTLLKLCDTFRRKATVV